MEKEGQGFETGQHHSRAPRCRSRSSSSLNSQHCRSYWRNPVFFLAVVHQHGDGRLWIGGHYAAVVAAGAARRHEGPGSGARHHGQLTDPPRPTGTAHRRPTVPTDSAPPPPLNPSPPRPRRIFSFLHQAAFLDPSSGGPWPPTPYPSLR